MYTRWEQNTRMIWESYLPFNQEIQRFSVAANQCGLLLELDFAVTPRRFVIWPCCNSRALRVLYIKSQVWIRE